MAIANSTFKYNGHTYFLTSTLSTWQEAESEAVRLGGHLVTINDKSENDWLINSFAFDSETYWIGYTDQIKEGTWTWINGENSIYTNWSPSEPNNVNDEDFTEINFLGWNDTNTTKFNRGIVEIPSLISVKILNGIPTLIPKVTLLIGNNPIEGGAAGKFNINLDTRSPPGGLTIYFDTSGSSATYGIDYTFSEGINITNVTENFFTIKEGATAASLNVIALGDNILDPKEKIKMHILDGDSYIVLNSPASFSNKIDYSTGLAVNYFPCVADINGDGKDDVAVASSVSNLVSVFLRNTNNTGFNPKIDYSTSVKPGQIYADDFNNDGKTDLLITNPSNNSFSILLRNSTNTGFEPNKDYTINFSPHYVSSGDFNCDGKTDLVIINSSSSKVSVYLRDATNTGYASFDYETGSQPVSIAVGDFNNDGKEDLATANLGSNTISVLLRNANNTGFDTKVDYKGGAQPVAITAGDFNGDGLIDLAVANWQYTVSVFLRNTTNTDFNDKVDYPTDAYNTSVGVGDFNNDGQTDIVTGNRYSNLVSVFLRNTSNTDFDAKTNFIIAGSDIHTVSVGDFNNDRKLDLVTTNSGTDGNSISVLLNNTANSNSNTLIIEDVVNHPVIGVVSILGNTLQGKALSIDNNLKDADGLGSFNYQWLSNSNVISGANQNSYILTQAEVGKTISVSVSYTDGLGKLESVISSSTNLVTNVNDLPKGSVYIYGKLNQGQSLTASNDISDLDGLGAIDYQWMRNGSLINDANQSSYTLTANDVNSGISVKASYTDSYGTTESVTSSSITAQPPAQTPPIGSVNISGASQQNQKLTVSQSLADINGIGIINYEWLRNDNIISGQTQTSYTLTQTDVGKAISVRASYTDGLGKFERVTSSLTSLVVNVNDFPTGSLTISGDAKQGRMLTASNNIADADGLGTISYQWFRNGEIISNATSSSYTLTQFDADKTISVKATYIDAFGATENVISTSLLVAPGNILNVISPKVNEGDSGQTDLTFTLTLSKALQQTGSVDYALQSGSATASADFTTSSGTLQFKAGETSKTIMASILGDATIENDETFNLVLSNPRNFDLSNGLTSMTAVGTILNDDFPTLSIANTLSILEGNSGQSNLNFSVRLSEAPLSAVSVDYATKGLTATAGQDFTAQSGSLKFVAGEKEKTISIPVLGDTNEEPDETVSLVLSNPQSAKFAGSATQLNATGTILNDDSQSIRLSSPSIQEGDTGTRALKYVVSLGLPVLNDTSFDYKTEDGTATTDVDYVTQTGTVKIPAGSQSVEIPISILGDTRIEPNETVKLTLSNAQGINLPNGSLPISSVGTILDDDFPIVRIADAKTVYQSKIGLTRSAITVSLNSPALVDGTISYHTENGTALQGNDFIDTNTSGKIVIPANADSGVITIGILASDATDTPNEAFKVVIDKVEGGIKLPDNQLALNSVITIADLILPLLSIKNAEISEGNTGNKTLSFNVNLSTPANQDVTFSVKTIDKTATVDQDYKGVSLSMTILKGRQSIDIPVAILGDATSESDETFTLELSKVANAIFDNGDIKLTATGKILDDDKPFLRIEDKHVTEGNSGLHAEQIKVTLSTIAAAPVTVHYVSIDGTANAGEDFIKAEGDLTIPVGAKEASIPMSIQGDNKPESAQDFHIVLSNPVNGQFLNSALSIQNTVTIDTDDSDSLPQLSVIQKPVYEGDIGTIDYPVTLKLSTPATSNFSVDYQTLVGDAKAGSDFIAANGTVTFLAGDSTSQVTIKVYGDAEVELDENFTLQLSNPQGIRLLNDLFTQDIPLLIQDDDAEPPQTMQGTAKNDVLDATKNGGAGDDILDGLKGIDTMIGGDGNDIYYVDNIKDVIIEEDQSQSNAGDDDLVHSIATAYTLPANVEHLIIDGKLKGNTTGNLLDNKLTGNLAVNILSGLAGDDTLDGGSGNDMLTGGLGNDTFIFSSGIKGNKNIDTIKDFVHGQDKIYLSADIFSKLADAVGFKSGTEPLSLSKADTHYLVSAAKVKAVDVNSYLLYDTATGRLSYDEDGNGKLAASSFVTLTGKPTLTLDDFWIV